MQNNPICCKSPNPFGRVGFHPRPYCANSAQQAERTSYTLHSGNWAGWSRTTFLLEYIGDEDLRRIIQAAQNKCEGFNQFAQWVYFGADTITENVRDDQLKIIKYNHLIANLVIFHNCHTITQALKELEAEGMKLTPELIAGFSPYRTSHLNRFGLFDLKERYPLPIDYGVMFEI